MAAPYTYVRRKTEDAIASLINQLAGSDLSDVTEYKGLSGSDLTTPRLEIVCDRSTPQVPQNTVTGNFAVMGQAAIVTTYADTSRAVHQSYMAYVEDLFMYHWCEFVQMVKALNFVDYTMLHFEPGEGRDETNGTEYRSVIDFSVVCCASDVALPPAAVAYVPGG